MDLQSSATSGLDFRTAAETRRVLYIEDNPSNLKLVARALAIWSDYQLVTATSGRAGLEAAERDIDLILLDLNLPDIPGQDVLRRLRAQPSTEPIPVVILSADAMPERVASLRDSGATEYLTKPIHLPGLIRVVRNILEGTR